MLRSFGDDGHRFGKEYRQVNTPNNDTNIDRFVQQRLPLVSGERFPPKDILEPRPGFRKVHP